MTLIVTELSALGIIMTADSAVTQQVTIGNHPYTRVLTGALKLQLIPHLRAGISVWGQGTLPLDGTDVSTDIWLADFIRRHSQAQSTEAFATLLEHELRNSLGPRSGDDSTMGFHLAGFVDSPHGPLPDFWHIHDGPSQYFSQSDPTQFNANHDRPPQQYRPGHVYYTHNGDYRFYHVFLEAITALLNQAEQRLGAPTVPRTLATRAAFLRWQTRAVSDLYRLSGMTHIGGQIISLTIAPDGSCNFQWD